MPICCSVVWKKMRIIELDTHSRTQGAFLVMEFSRNLKKHEWQNHFTSESLASVTNRQRKLRVFLVSDENLHVKLVKPSGRYRMLIQSGIPAAYFPGRVLAYFSAAISKLEGPQGRNNLASTNPRLIIRSSDWVRLFFGKGESWLLR